MLSPAHAPPASSLRGTASLEPRQHLGALVPGLVVTLTGLGLLPLEGGFAPSVWYPTAMFLLAVLVLILAVGPPGRGERSRLAEASLAAYALFCAWSYGSILWAETPAAAWEGANRTLVYGIVLGIVAMRPWSRAPALTVTTTVGLGVAAIATGLLIATAVSDEPAQFFLESRLAAPAGYSNATAAALLMGFFPALHLAVVRGAPWPLRGLGLAGAVLLVETSVLCQSRGALLALAVTSALYLALAPQRWAVLAAMLAVTGALILAIDPLLSVGESTTSAVLADSLSRARTAIWWSAAAALVLGSLVALIGRRLMPCVARGRRAARAGRLSFAGLAVAALVAALVAVGNPATFLEARYTDFATSGYQRVSTEPTRFSGSLGSNRYDFWRVAVEQFRAHPVLGAGGDNFAASYLRARRSAEAPRYAHSLAFAILGELGAVGVSLFAVFLGLALAQLVRRLRGADSVQAGIAASSFAVFAYWLAHGMVDWLWAFPALGLLAFAMLAVALRSESASCPPKGIAVEARSPRPGDAGWRALLAGAALLTALSFALPGVSARYTAAAYRRSAVDPAAALNLLDRAATFNRLSAEPLIVEGVVAGRLGLRSRAVDAFRTAVAREPANWFALFELGVYQSGVGRRVEALASLRGASRLNPRQPLVREALARITEGRSVDASQLELQLKGQLDQRLRPAKAR